MKKIFLLLIPVILGLSSCESNVSDGNIPLEADEKEVEINVSTPISVLTRGPQGVVDEDAVSDMQILVFQGKGDNAQYLYRKYAWRKAAGSQTFKSTLKIGADLTLCFVANAKDVLDAKLPAIVEGGGTATLKNVREGLVMEGENILSCTNGIPMWGQCEEVEIEDKALNNIGRVNMLRSLAGTDVFIKETARADFELETGYLVFPASKGYLAYDPAKVTASADDIVADEPYTPSDIVTNTFDLDYSVAQPGTDYSIENIFYMYDNDTQVKSDDPQNPGPGVPVTPNRRPTKVVIEGTWTGAGAVGRPTFYPLAFREKVADDLVKTRATRNHKYQISVTKVNGDGYDSLNDAKEGESINVDYDVIEWEYEDDKEIIIDGNYYVSIDRKIAQMPRGANNEDLIHFVTNYPSRNIKISADKHSEGVELGQKVTLKVLNGPEENKEFCDVWVLPSGSGPQQYYFRFLTTNTIDQGNHAANYYREGVVYVTIGKIRFEIWLRQYNISDSDWGDGGEIPWG